MDDWNQTHHSASGLLERVRQSTFDTQHAQSQVLEFLKTHVPVNQSPLCGNTIYQDRRFLNRHMPLLDQYLHYRLVDVSSIKELAARWYPTLPPFKKSEKHLALDDIRESIGELAYYRTTLFAAQPRPLT
jgi:oligoribonuclease